MSELSGRKDFDARVGLVRQLSGRIHEPFWIWLLLFLRGRDIFGGRWGLPELSSR
jgi:hypothetical protein